MKLTSHPTATEFLAVVEGPLMHNEARNNLILGIAGRVRDGRCYGDDPPLFLTLAAAGKLVVAAIRTPPYLLIVHCEDGRVEALDLAIDHLMTVDPHLPGVNGEADVAGAFARRWTSRVPVRADLERAMRIYVLYRVARPVGVPGRMRPAREEDIDLLADWMEGFQREAVPGDPPSDPRRVVRRFLDTGTLVLWDDGGPVSMAGSSRGSEHGAAVSAVYTPPERRRNGYASACVAGLSQLMLDRGNAFCTLYTDLANATSNKIYQRIGYRPVCDAASYRFVPTGSEVGEG